MTTASTMDNNIATTTNNNNMDNEGRCLSHPFVQLQRLSIVTGKWKTLLDCCPLCAMDNKSVTSRSECSSICSETSSSMTRRRQHHQQQQQQGRSSQTQQQQSPDVSSSVSTTSQPALRTTTSASGRVRFQPEKDVQFTTALNDLSSRHQHHFKRSISSASLPGHYISSGSSVSSNVSKSALKAQPRYKVCKERMQQQLDDSEKVTTMSMDIELEFSMDDIVLSSEVKMRDNEEVDDVEDVIPMEEMVLPDPEEFPCCAPLTTSTSSSSGSSSSSQRHQSTTYSTSSSSTSQQQQKGWNYHPSQMHSLQASPSLKARQQQPKQQHQPIYAHNMVIDPTPDYDDEVSTLNSTGYSVQSPKVPSSSYSSHHAAASSSAIIIDDNISVNTHTNDCDESGRCIHHPHIRLRKKKLFGKGWKILMTACPDCCVNELHRIRAVAENKARIKERSEGTTTTTSTSSSSGGGSSSRRRSSSLSNHSDSNYHGEEDRCATPRRRGSSSNSREGGGEEQGGSSRTRSTSRSSSNRRSTTEVRSPSQEHRTTRSPAPPKRSPSQSSTDRFHHHHHQSRPTSNTKMFLHRESDETTASLTGSSSGSSNEITPDNSDRTSGGSLSSGEVQQKVVNITNLRTYDNANRNSKQQRHYEQHHQEEEDVVEQHQHQHQQARGTIQVRKMQWTDPKNGQMGSYTGQVNTHFIPHGYGVMEYHDPSVLVKEGKWKDGRYRKSNNGSSRKGEVGGVGRSSSRSASRSRSKSRDVGHRSSTTTRARSSSRRPTEQVVVVGGGGGTS